MDLLHRLSAPFRRVAGLIVLALGVSIWALSLAVEILFGEFEWHAPRWLLALRRLLAACWRWLIAHRRTALRAAGAALLVVVAVLAGKWWYDSRPHPVEITFRVTGPPITRY